MSIIIRLGKERIDSGLRKFGVIMGDDAQTACNSVSNPGTLMGKKSMVYPCVSFGGIIQEKEIVKEEKSR